MPGPLRFDCFEVDLAAHQLYRRGVRVRLRDQSFQVLALLLEYPGQVVTREDLQHRLWTDDVFVDFENSLNTAVARLREALCDSADRPRYIETLPRLGYRFIAPIAQPTHASEPAAAPRPKTRLLVLPFVNSSGDPSQEYFSDAMTDEIITELSALAPACLGVIARTTAMRYKGTHKDVAKIGRELSVDWVMEGSARRAGDRVALTAQLVRASDQTHVLARRYDADFGDVFDVERAVAQAVGEQMGILPDAQRPGAGAAVGTRAPRKPTQDLVAYNLYIQGRHHLDSGQSPQSWGKAREYLEAAIARDPRFALAHDALAELWWNIGFFGIVPPRETLRIGMSHALRAVEIDDSVGEAHAMLAQYRKQLEFDWTEVEREMALALALNPTSPIVRRRHAITGLLPHGRFDEAVTDLELALELDPLGLHSRAWLGIMLWLGRRYDRAIEQGRLVTELSPNHFMGYWTLGMACREAGIFGEAIAAHRRAVELTGGNPVMLGWFGLALAESGDTIGARSLLERLRGMSAHGFVPPTSFAWIHVGLGDADEFFAWMDRAIDARDHMIMPIKSYRFFDRVRDDPRFADLLRRVRLA